MLRQTLSSRTLWDLLQFYVRPNKCRYYFTHIYCDGVMKTTLGPIPQGTLVKITITGEVVEFTYVPNTESLGDLKSPHTRIYTVTMEQSPPKITVLASSSEDRTK
jgi:hypothetical protein